MSLRVLIVDDEALARSRLRRLLGECTAPAAEVVGEAANTATTYGYDPVTYMQETKTTLCSVEPA